MRRLTPLFVAAFICAAISSCGQNKAQPSQRKSGSFRDGEGPTAAQDPYRSLVGGTIADVETQLGKADEIETFPGVVQVHYHSKGLSFEVKYDRVASILFYSGRAGGWNGHGFTRYEGQLPRGLDFDMDYGEVVSILGDSFKTSNLSTAPTPAHSIFYPNDLYVDFVSETQKIISIGIEEQPK